MLQIKIKISNIDYRDVSDKVVPIIVEKMNVKNEKSKKNRILSKLIKPASTAMNILPQGVKDDVAVNLIKTFKDKIHVELDKFIHENKFHMKVSGIDVIKEENMNLSICLEDVDYKELITGAYPKIKSKLNEDEKYNKLFSILDKYSGKLIHAVLQALSQEEKDELVISIISAYEKEIIALINTLAESNGIKLSISGIDLK